MPNFDFGKKLDKSITEENQIVGAIKELYDSNINQLRPLYQSLLLNMSYISGDQYKFIDPDTKKLKDFYRIGGYEEREVYNLMRNMKTTFKARITQKKPYPFATPITTKEKDKRIASITNAVIDDEWEKQNIEDKIDIIGEYLATFGSAFLKVIWNNELGDRIFPDIENIINQVENTNYLNPDMKETLLNNLYRKKDIYEGDVQVDVLTPFEFQVDSISRRNLEEAQYCIHSRIYHKDVLKLLYNLKDDDLPDEEINAVTMQEGSVSNGLGYVYNNNGFSTSRLKDHNILHEYYERPSLEYPNGRLIISVGKKIVYYKEKIPYNVGRDNKPDFPFIRIVASEEIGNFYGATPISDLRPIQRKYNSVQNRKMEALSRIAIGQWKVAEGSLSQSTELNNTPGNIIGYRNGRKPPEKVVDQTNLTEFRNEIESLNSLFVKVPGFSAYDVTQINSAVRSATQMSMLMEQEDLRMITPVLQIARGIKYWAKFTIRLLQQYTVGQRFVKYQEKYDNDLGWNKDLINDNIHIKNKNALVKSPAQQQQMLMDLMGMGIFDEQNRYGYDNTMLALESFGMGSFKADVNIPHKKDIEKAKRENKRAVRQMLIDVDKVVDNHMVHIKEHSDFLKSEEYEEIMIGLDPQIAIEVDKMLHDHIEKHQMILQIKATNIALAQQRAR
jgi:hypothetical protein